MAEARPILLFETRMWVLRTH